MSSSPLIRVVLAMYLAIWSPVMCCCGIKATLARLTGSEPMQCEAQSCCALDSSRTARELERSCRETQESQSSCCDDSAQSEQDQSAPTNDGKCRCHEKPSDRLDTGGKITLPVLTWQATFEFTSCDEPGLHCVASSFACCEAPCSRSHAPPNSLLAQHCLLLI